MSECVVFTTSYGARPALLEINRTPYDARPILHVGNTFLRPMMFTFISKFVIISPKKQIVKKRKIEADPDSDGGKNQDCTRLQKKFNSTCSLHVLHPQLLKRNIYFCIYTFWFLEVKYLFWCNKYFCKYTSLLTGCSSTHKTSAGARTGVGRFVKRFTKVPGAFQTSNDAIETKIVRCTSDVYKRHVILPSMTLQNTVREPWNFKLYPNFTGPYERRRIVRFFGK